ncbi:MAG: lipase [Actinomycetota bacterium]|jgi:hypothetical protein|nr:lipase [Actinomycetota bacterium]
MEKFVARLRARFLAAVLALTLVASAVSVGVGAPAAYASSSPQLPSRDAFYRYSGPLASIAPGTVLRSRTVTIPWGGLDTPVTATQLLYRTTTELGAPTVTVTTVLRPDLVLPVGILPVKIVSWQMFYDALGPQCDPSYTLRGGNSSYGDAQEEEALMTPYLAAGDVLVVSDYEGENLAWGAGQQSGYETLDGIRAAEHWLQVPATTTPVAMIGYSGGSIATQWAAEMAPAYAPHLDIVGAAAGGVPVDYAHNLTYINGSADWSGVIPAILLGVSRAFGVDLGQYLSAYGRKVVSQVSGGCINTFVGNYPGLTIQKLLAPKYQDFLKVPVFASILNELTMGSDGTPRVPLLFANGNADGTGDGVMVAADVEGLAHLYCTRGLSVRFDEYKGLDHDEAAVPFEVTAFPVISGWLAGADAPSGCGAIGTGNALTPLGAGTAPPAAPPSAASSATVTSVEPSGAASVVDGAASVTLHGAGAATLAVFRAYHDPVGWPTFDATGHYLDVGVAPRSELTSLVLSDCHVGRGNAMEWWDPAAHQGAGAWQPVRSAGAKHAGGAGCSSVTLSRSSSPTLSQLTGTVFAIAHDT